MSDMIKKSYKGNPITISPYNQSVDYETWFTPAYVLDIIKTYKLKGLMFFDSRYFDETPLTSDFIGDYPFIEHLSFISHQKSYTHDFLFELKRLESLLLLTYLNEDHVVDLKKQVNLKRLTINWRPKIRNADAASELESLILEEWKDKNLDIITSFPKLEKLRLATANVTNLSHVTDLPRLRELRIGNCRSLKNLSPLNSHQGIKKLEIHMCSKIEDWDALKDLPNLEELHLIDCRVIPSIKFTENFPKLKTLHVLGSTVIEDNDLSPMLRIKELRYNPRDRYNIDIPRGYS